MTTDYPAGGWEVGWTRKGACRAQAVRGKEPVQENEQILFMIVQKCTEKWETANKKLIQKNGQDF